MDKIKVLVSGCNGQMGQIVCRLIKESEDMKVIAGIDIEKNDSYDFPVFTIDALKEQSLDIDVIIDFSTPSCTMNLLENFAYANHIPIVIATTGFSDKELCAIKKYSEKSIIFLSSNMSYQVCLIERILREISPKLPNYDIEIVETHHKRKKDAPSGTALSLAKAINSYSTNPKEIVYGREGKRNPNEIGISSLRGGNIVGTHTISFFGEFDTIEITHTALSRDMFAEGAIKAASYVLNQAKNDVNFGLFNMKNLM